MAVDISDLVESLVIEVNPPGTDLYPTMTSRQWTARLLNAFWEAKMQGAFPEYTLNEDDDIVHMYGGPDMPREQQQLIVLYAGFQIVLTEYTNLNSSFRAKAGPVEFETQKSAQLLKGLLDAFRERMKAATELATGSTTAHLAAVYDGLAERTLGIANGPLFYVR